MSELGVFACIHVFERSRQVLLIVHDGADVSYLCGGYDHDDSDDSRDYKVIGFNHLLEWDSTVLEPQLTRDKCEYERHVVGQEWRESSIE